VRVTTTNGHESHYSISLSTFLFEELLHLGKNKEGAKGTKDFFPKKMGPSCYIMRQKKDY